MADFTALKTAIQNAIKQNGNEEITGTILQEIMLAVVSTLGDSAINDLVTALSNEVTNRQNADGTLQSNINAEQSARQLGDSTLQSGINNERDLRIAADNALGTRIDNEATARGNADTALQNAINAINTKLAEGYVYVGIATTSTNPSTPSGKVFYIAAAAGTYTNFLDSGSAALVLTQGINIMKYNGTSWAVEQVWGVDDVPTAESNNLVKSGGVAEQISQLGQQMIYDVSANNDGATFASLSALLSSENLSTLIPTAVRCGGMSIRFVQSSDNKYVQYRLTSDSFNTTETNWQKQGAEVSISQNTSTGHTDISVGGAATPVASVNDVESIGTKLDHQLSQNNPIIPQATEVAGLISSTPNFTANAEFKVLFFRVVKGETIKVTTDYSFYTAYSYDIPEVGVKSIDSTFHDIVASDEPFVATYDGYFCVSIKNDKTVSFKIVNNGYAVQNDNRIKNIEDDIIVGDFIPLDATTIEGLRVTSTKINTQSAGENLHYLPCIANVPVTLKWNIGGGNFMIGVTATIPALNVTVTQFKQRAYPTYASDTYTFKPEINGYVVFSYIAATGNYGFVITHKSSGIGYDVYILKQDKASILADIESLASSSNEQDGKILDLQRNVYEDEATISPDVTLLDNVICGETAGFVVNNNFVTNYIRVWKGLKFKVTTNYVCYLGYSLNEPAIGVTQGISGWTDQQTVLDNEEFTSNITGYFFISIKNDKTCSFAIPNTDSIAYRVAQLEGGAGGASLDDKIVFPSELYEIVPNAGFNATNRLFVEGLTKDSSLQKLRINGLMNSIVTDNSQAASVKSYNVPITVSAKGYADKIINVPVRRELATAAQNKSIKIHCIGDSLTIGGYPAIVEYIFKRLNASINNITSLMVGTKLINEEITYNDIAYTCRGCCDGNGGYGLNDFLRHKWLVRIGTGTSTDRNLMIGKVAWDSLGLGTKTRNGVPEQSYVTYTDTVTQRELLRTTCHGWYDAEPTEDLYNYLYNVMELRSFAYNGTTYTLESTYGATSSAAITNAIKFCCTDPTWMRRGVQFYDYNTVQSSNGQYAFNYAEFFNKYRTLASDGTTRLVVGSTAGTLVTSVNAYDVCDPNFVVICMGQNDISSYANVAGIISDYQLMSTLIKSAFPDMKIALMSNRPYGSIEPTAYSDLGDVGKGGYNSLHRTWYESLKDIGSQYGELINLYQTQTVIGHYNESVNTLNAKDAVSYSKNDYFTHTRLQYYIDRAYQVAAWVICKLGES